MTKRVERFLSVGVLVGAALSLTVSSTPSAKGGRPDSAPAKLDRALSRLAARASGATVKVIVTPKPGHREEVRNVIGQHTPGGFADQPFIDSLVAEVPDSSLNEIAQDARVAHVSPPRLRVRRSGLSSRRSRDTATRSGTPSHSTRRVTSPISRSSIRS